MSTSTDDPQRSAADDPTAIADTLAGTAGRGNGVPRTSSASRVDRGGEDAPTEPSTLDDAATASAVLAAVPGPGRPFASAPRPGAPQTWNAGVRRDEAERLLVRPAWHSWSTPDSVLEARRVLEREGAELQTALDRVLRGVDAEEATEAATIRRSVAASVEAGRDPKPPKRADWQHARDVALEVHAVARRRALAAAETYRRAVAEALPQWRRALLEDATDKRAAAAEALARVAPQVEDALAAVDAVRAVAQEVDASGAADAGRMTRDASALREAGRHGAAAALGLLRSSDPVLSGEAFGPEMGRGVQPSLHARAAIWDTDSNAVQVLGNVEAREGWQVTQYTWDHRRHFANVARDAGHGGLFGI